jgi:hypothetical protein
MLIGNPQDASQYKNVMELSLFASHSMPAFYIDLLSPSHWVAKQQWVTAGNSAEAEIYATDVFYLTIFKFWNFLKLNIYSCWMSISSTMIIRLVSIDQRSVPPKVFIIFR